MSEIAFWVKFVCIAGLDQGLYQEEKKEGG